MESQIEFLVEEIESLKERNYRLETELNILKTVLFPVYHENCPKDRSCYECHKAICNDCGKLKNYECEDHDKFYSVMRIVCALHTK